MEAARAKGHVDLLLLSVLADGPAHGYALIERLRERSQGELDFPEGTIYPALHRLEAEKFLSSRWAEAGGRRRRVYALTRRGRGALRTRVENWRAFVQVVNTVVEGAA
jgi:PadR family transcriptional regulator